MASRKSYPYLVTVRSAEEIDGYGSDFLLFLLAQPEESFLIIYTICLNSLFDSDEYCQHDIQEATIRRWS